MDMRAVMPAGLEQIDPKTVELRLAAKVECQFLRKRRGMAHEIAPELGESRVAFGKVVQRRVAGVALVALVTAPALSGFIIFGERADRMSQLAEQLLVLDHCFVEPGCE